MRIYITSRTIGTQSFFSLTSEQLNKSTINVNFTDETSFFEHPTDVRIVDKVAKSVNKSHVKNVIVNISLPLLNLIHYKHLSKLKKHMENNYPSLQAVKLNKPNSNLPGIFETLIMLKRQLDIEWCDGEEAHEVIKSLYFHKNNILIDDIKNNFNDNEIRRIFLTAPVSLVFLSKLLSTKTSVVNDRDKDRVIDKCINVLNQDHYKKLDYLLYMTIPPPSKIKYGVSTALASGVAVYSFYKACTNVFPIQVTLTTYNLIKIDSPIFNWISLILVDLMFSALLVHDYNTKKHHYSTINKDIISKVLDQLTLYEEKETNVLDSKSSNNIELICVRPFS